MPKFVDPSNGNCSFVSALALANPTQEMLDNMSAVYIDANGIRYESNGTALVPQLSAAQTSAVQALVSGGGNLGSSFVDNPSAVAEAFAVADVVRTGPGTLALSAQLIVPAGKKWVADKTEVVWAAAAPTDDSSLVHFSAGSEGIGLTVDAADSGQTNGFGISATSGVRLTQCVGNNATNVGINVVSGASDVVLSLCEATGNRVGIQALNATNVDVVACRASENTAEGLLVHEGSCANITVDGGNYSDNGDSGVSIGAGAVGISVVGAVCDRNAHQGIELQSVESAEIVGNKCRYNTKNGILISKYGATGTSLSHDVGPNLCEFNGQAGMQIAGSSLVTVTGGIYRNNSQASAGANHGVQIVKEQISNQSCYRVTVSGVLATDTQGTKTQGYGLYVSGDAHTVIRTFNNDVDGNLTGAFYDNSTCSSGGSYTGQFHRNNSTQPAISAPAVPARYAYTYNLQRQPVRVSVGCPSNWLGAGIGGPGRSEVVQPGPTTGGTYTLMPGEYIYLDYTGTAPTWAWEGI